MYLPQRSLGRIIYTNWTSENFPFLDPRVQPPLPGHTIAFDLEPPFRAYWWDPIVVGYDERGAVLGDRDSSAGEQVEARRAAVEARRREEEAARLAAEAAAAAAAARPATLAVVPDVAATAQQPGIPTPVLVGGGALLLALLLR